MEKSPQFVLNYLKEIESLANDVLANKRDLTELSIRRDKLREGHRYLCTRLTRVLHNLKAKDNF